jgi:type VI secretion system secreted protein VgrG
VGHDHFRSLLALEHEDLYVVDVAAIPAAIQYRPACATAWPRIYGFESAVVDGPATSEYAQIDVQGRYNVKLHFDESALKNGKASTLLRMMQPHGGDIEGFHFPLRKGTEVVVIFLGGDPDRPVISGVVPNALHPSAVTSGNYTKNVIQTGGRNRLEIEDLCGQERVTLSTPLATTYLLMGSPDCGHHAILKTDGNILIQAGEDLDVIAGGHKHETIGGEVTETYESTLKQTVTGPVTETYESTLKQTVTGPVTETYESTLKQTVTGAVTETYESTLKQTVTGTVTEIYGGLLHQTLKAGWTVNVTGNVTQTATGNYTVTHGGDHTATTNGGFLGFVKGPSFEVYAANKGTFVAGAYDTWVLGVKDDIIVGAKFEIVVGDKFKYGSSDLDFKELKSHWCGAKFWYDTLHIATAATKIASAATEVKDHAVRVVNAGMNLFT